MATRTPRVPGAAARAEPAPQVVDQGSLPNAIDIDPRAIEAPVLTRQGWVVPDEEYRTKAKKVAAMQRELDEARG
jgi:hypothetical protein